MPSAYERIADIYIESDREVKNLFAPPQQEVETPFSDYYREKKEGIDWTAPLEFLGKGAEQTFGMLGSIATRAVGARPVPEMERGVLDPRRLAEHLPGGVEYKAYQEWKEKQKPLWNLPEWMGLLGQIMEIGPAEVYEMAPLIFMGGGAAKAPLEKVADVASRQLLKGKSTEEAIKLASSQAVKKGWVKAPRVKPPEAIPEVKPPITEKPPIVPEMPPQPVKPITEPLKPPISPTPLAKEPVNKLTNLIRSAKPVRKETEVLKHEELRKRAAAFAEVLERGEGREAFISAKTMLKGELPKAKFAPPEASLTPDDLLALHNRIKNSELLPFQKLNVDEALQKLLSGELPTRGEIEWLEKVFGTNFAKAILSQRPMGQKAWETFLDVWNIPRTLVASGEISGSLRQGVRLVAKRPKVWGGAFRAQLNAVLKEENAIAIDRMIQTSKYAELRAESGLYHAPITGVGAKLTQREEVFVSQIIQRFAGWWEQAPAIKKTLTAPLYPGAKMVRISERAYITFLNKLRADYFDSVVVQWEKIGYQATRKDFEELALFVNRASGRGSLGKLEESAPFLSGILFSPRLQASYITMGNSLLTATAPVRKEAALALAAFVGMGISVLSLAHLAGAEVGINPLSADFGKIRIGKTRLDIWGGFQQYARFMANMATGMRTSSITGQTYEKNRMEMIQQFVRSKLMPSLSFFYDLMEGRTYIGEKMEMDVQQAYQRLAPMFVQDLTDAIEAEGLVGGFIASPGALGIGIVSYDLPNWPELEEYFKLETTQERNAYRMANPKNEAKLFILGRFTTLKTPQAKQEVLKIMEEHKIKPEDIRGYENVFGEGAEAIGGRTWGAIRSSLDSGTLGALNRLWYGGGSLTEGEKSRLWGVHQSNPMGQPVFNTWVKQTLRQAFEKSLVK